MVVSRKKQDEKSQTIEDPKDDKAKPWYMAGDGREVRDSQNNQISNESW